MTALLGLVREAAFPLFAVHPRHWAGAAFVGDTERIGGALTSVALVYEEPGRGFEIDNVAPGTTAVDDDFVRFVARFDARYVTKRVRRRKTAFPEASFASTRIQTSVGGAAVSLDALEHKDIPLTIVPLRMDGAGGPTDVWACGWHMDLRDIVPLIEPIDAEMVAAFDHPGEPYPPPEWEVPEAGTPEPGPGEQT